MPDIGFEKIGDLLHFENLSAHLPASVSYAWHIEGTEYTEENPIVDYIGMDETVYAELVITDSISGCSNTIERTFYVAPEGDCAETIALFEYEVTPAGVTFYNTSENVYAGANISWNIGRVYNEPDDSIFFPHAELDTIDNACLRIFYPEDSCYHYVCTPLYTETDTVICALETAFDFEYDDGNYYFENTSTGVPLGATYEWNVGGTLYTTENLTLTAIDFDPIEIVCLTIDGGLDYCIETYCDTIELALDTIDCSVTNAHFYYYGDGDSTYFINASDDVFYGAVFTWYVNGEDYVTTEMDTLSIDNALLSPTSNNVYLAINYPSHDDCFDYMSIWLDLADIPCDVPASFEYETIGDSLYLYNTTAYTTLDATFDWFIDGAHFTDENPIIPTATLESSEFINLIVTNTACFTAAHDTIYPVIACELNTNFWNNIVGDSVYFFSSTWMLPDFPVYEWSIDGLTSTLQHPVFAIADLEEYAEICLTISDYYAPYCYDQKCKTIYFGNDSTYCEGTNASFYYEVTADSITFINTSTGVTPDAYVSWVIQGDYSTDSIGTVSYALSDFDDSEEACLKIHYPYPASILCSDSTCLDIVLATDTTVSSMIVSFGYSITDGVLTASHTTIDLPPNPLYAWTFGMLTSTEESPSFELSGFDNAEELCLTITSETTEIEGASCELVETLSLPNGETKTQFLLYPNPTVDHLTVSFSNPTLKGEFVIYDLTGKVVYSKRITDPVIALDMDVTTLESGIYFVSLIQDDNTQSPKKRFTKQ